MPPAACSAATMTRMASQFALPPRGGSLMSGAARHLFPAAIYFLLAACAPRMTPVVSRELPSRPPLSGDMISMAIEEVSCPGSRTLVRILVEADRSYWGDLDATPPPHAMLRDVQLSDAQGRSYPPDAEWGEPAHLDLISGTIQLRMTEAFQGLACDASELTFTSGAALGAGRGRAPSTPRRTSGQASRLRRGVCHKAHDAPPSRMGCDLRVWP